MSKKLIVGLGNPGKKYEKTRHNLGFMALDALLRKVAPVEKTKWKEGRKFNSLIAKIDGCLLAKPQTFMNASGLAVAKLANFYKVKPEDIWIVHDEIDLPLGKIKISQGAGSAGHRGIASVIEQLGESQFVRFRLGIGHPRLKGSHAGLGSDQEVERYALKEFDVNEKTEVKQMIKKAVKAIEVALEKGIEVAMNRFN